MAIAVARPKPITLAMIVVTPVLHRPFTTVINPLSRMMYAILPMML